MNVLTHPQTQRSQIAVKTPDVAGANNYEAALTVLIPIYNEAECVPQLVVELEKFLEVAPMPVEIVFINDGSTDDSQMLIERACETHPAFHYIQLRKNEGLSAALKAGIDACTTSLVGYMDADLQTSPMDFLKLLPHLPAYDMATGIRQKRKDKLVKRISSKVANRVRRWLIHDGIEDTGCPLKIMKTEYAKAIPFFTGMHRFLPALFQIQDHTVKQIPVQHFPRYAGKAKYNLRNRLIKPFVDAIVFRWMRNRSIHYAIEKAA